MKDCSPVGCESCERALTGFQLRGACEQCGHALCPRVVPVVLGGLRA